MGQAARDMYGRVSDNIEVVRPLQHGVIAALK
jgi:actin-like ATPase involved in cell morphogenesis